jgi:predicted RNA-binding protein YlqC (UPF0109 family)
MQAFLEFVVKELEDAGKIIGRRGGTIQAIRSVLQVGAAKAGRRCTVDLVEDE